MAKLPGLGPRSARRAVLHLIRKRALLLTPLADVMQVVAVTARECLNCGNVGTEDICDICTSEKRGNGELCVVEDVADQEVLRIKARANLMQSRGSVLPIALPNPAHKTRAVDARRASEYFSARMLASCVACIDVLGELEEPKVEPTLEAFLDQLLH